MNLPRRPSLQRLRPTALQGAVRRRPRLALGVVLAVAFALIGLGGALALSSGPAPAAPAADAPFTYNATWSLLDLERHIDAGEVAAISVPADSGNSSGVTATLLARTRDGQTVKVQLTVSSADAAAGLAALGHGNLLTSEAWQAAASAPALSGGSADDPLRAIVTIAGPALLVVLLVVVVLRLMRTSGAGQREHGSSFLTVMPRPAEAGAGDAAAAAVPPAGDPNAVRLADVAGCDEAKHELTETIDFLTGPERFRRLGARIPRGTLLFGPPGTGKTMLAKAVATEAGVPFVYASGSEFVEKYVGVGARRVRDLFGHARRLGRAVVFLDEFDAIAKARGGANSHEEREQTLNQLLIELDGFSSTDEVVVIAATNRLDVLDPAVLRPGRFNRKIHVGLPDVQGRREILAVHAANKPLAPGADLDALARKTYGFSGAQLADVLNEAAILAARREADVIEQDDLHGGWLKVAVGTGRRRSMDERERSIIAAHEVGHAICGRVHGDKRKVEEISLFAHGEALGVTVSSQEDNDLPAESDLRARLVALMGGRAAEELLFSEVTGGASDDFDKANQIAASMVTRWGMGRDPDAAELGTSGRGPLGFLVAAGSGSLPPEVQPAATRAIRGILDDAYEQACETLVATMPVLRRIAAYLVEHERIDGETFDALFEGRLEAGDADAEWRPVAARPRPWAEIAPYRQRRRTPVRPLAPVLAPVPLAAAQAATATAPAPASPAAAAAAPSPELPAAPTPAPAAAAPPLAAATGPGWATAQVDTAEGRGRDGHSGRDLPGGRTPALRSLRRRIGGRVERRLRGIVLGTITRAEAWLRRADEFEGR